MKFLRTLTLCGLALALSSFNAGAAEPSKEDIAKAETRATVLGELALSADLANFGRDAKSPESLAVAGGMLIRAKKAFGSEPTQLEETPKDDKGKAVAVEKAASLDKQAEALFDEARAMVAGDKARGTALEATIKGARSFGRDGAAESRGACGGARTVNCSLAPGQTHTFQISFTTGQQASVCLTSSGPSNIQFDVIRTGDGLNLFSIKGKTANYAWIPARSPEGTRKFTITLHNPGQRPTTYTLTTN